MTATTKVFATGALAGAMSFLAAAATAADLEVSMEGLNSAEGRALVALHRYVPDAPFPGEEGVVARMAVPADPDGVRVVFADLPPGDYAVAAFHDADADGRLAANILGIPTEGYGFSNGARGFMGPPAFEDAAFAIGPDAERLSVVVPVVYPGSSHVPGTAHVGE